MDCIDRIKLCFENLRLNNNNNNNNNDDYDRSMMVYQNEKINNLNECIICLEDMKFNDDLILVKCSHIYHKECLEKWMVRRSVCPLCDIKI